MSGLESLAAEAAAWARAQAADVEAEFYLSRSEDRVLARREGARESVETGTSVGAGVRVLRAGRAGFAAAPSPDAETLRALWRRALEQSAQAEPDPRRVLPAPSRDAGDPGLAATLWDGTLFARPWDALEARLLEAEAAAAAAGARVLRAELSESRGEAVVASTRGVRARERGASVALSVSAAAERGGETQVGEGWRSSRRFDALAAAEAGREAARRAVSALGAGRARPGRRAVVLEPWVTAEFLEVLADLLSAEEVHGGRSLLAGRRESPVASPLVCLRDDPRLPGGLGSALFDDEGVPTRDKALIERGVLREFLYDSATAAREGKPSNGCAGREGWRGLPGPAPSNLYLAPGALSRGALIRDTRDGLLVLEVLGAHMADPVSGEFSVGVSGLEIEGGAAARPFQGAMIAGNLLDLLARVDAIADDLVFHGPFGAPTLRVSALDVA